MCQFIVTTLDEAADHLPPVISNKSEELGRFTQPIALTLKAKLFYWQQAHCSMVMHTWPTGQTLMEKLY